MITINTLKDYPLIDETIDKLTERLNNTILRKQDTCDTLKAAKARPDASQHTEVGNTVLSAVARICDNFEEEIKDIEFQISKWLIIQRDVRHKVYEPNVLTKEERRIIELSFFEEVNWKLIPQIMNYSKKQCYNIQNSALYKIGIKIDRKHNKTA